MLLAFTIPATRRAEEEPFIGFVRAKIDAFAADATGTPHELTERQSHALKEMGEAAQAVQTPLAIVEHALLRPLNFLIVPAFALANSGADLGTTDGAAFVSPSPGASP